MATRLEDWLRTLPTIAGFIKRTRRLGWENRQLRKLAAEHGLALDVSSTSVDNESRSISSSAVENQALKSWIKKLEREIALLTLETRMASSPRRDADQAKARNFRLTPPRIPANPRVSIVIPVYNGSDYVSEAIDSALGQTYDNLEIIVVNDGSDDDGRTAAICRSYGDQIVYIEQENAGVAGAMNRAFEALTGDYFCWLSHDDRHLPTKTEKQVEFLKSLGRYDLAAFSNYALIDEDGDEWHRSSIDSTLLSRVPSIALMRGYVNGCTLMVPSWAVRKHLPFDESLRYTQDYDMWERIRDDIEFVFQNVVTVQYRIHRNQDTNKPEASEESNRLWQWMMDRRPVDEQIAMGGSRHKYYADLEAFLSETPYTEAAFHAGERARDELQATVSVVIPVFNNDQISARAVRSALTQTHTDVEVVVIDDGSTEPLIELDALEREHENLRVVRQDNAGPGAARNLGMSLATGEYIAFLDSDDLFLPHKLAKQVQLMMETGSLFSHTSYYVRYPEGRQSTGEIRSATASGNRYRNLIRSCAIATPTVMIHSSLVRRGLKFPVDTFLGEDILVWLWIAARHDVLGIDECLSIVTWRDDSAALDIDKAISGITHMMRSMYRDPYHRLHAEDIEELGVALHDLVRMREWARSQPEAKKADRVIVRDALLMAFDSASKPPVPNGLYSYVYEVGIGKKDEFQGVLSKRPRVLSDV